jgi:type III secretion protein F
MVISVDTFVESGMSRIDKMQTSLEDKMKSMMDSETEIKPEELITLQYEMGKYQTMMTTLNNVTQSMENQTKELAKSIH